MSRRCLLLLGSDRDDPALLHQALAQLAELGKTSRLTETRRLPSDNGDGRWYFNALAQLQSDLPAGELVAACKRIEQELGRSDDAPEVPIDIDLLAVDHGRGWQADPHAVAKREFDRAAVRSLLQGAGIEPDDLSAA